jgi:hypothetical protein
MKQRAKKSRTWRYHATYKTGTEELDRHISDTYPQIKAVRNWHTLVGVNTKWDAVRVRRLCEFLEVSEPELAAVINCPTGRFLRPLIRGQRMRGCAALLLSIIEAHVLYGFDKDIPEKNIPVWEINQWLPKIYSKNTAVPENG